jgi:hypothetical protein
MLSAVLALAVGASCLWDVDLGSFSLALFLHSCSRMLPQSCPCNHSLHSYGGSTRLPLITDKLASKGRLRSLPGFFDRAIVSTEPVRLSLASHASSFISSISNDCKKDLDIHTILTNCLVVGGESNCRVDDLNFSRFRASESCASTSEHGPIIIARDQGDYDSFGETSFASSIENENQKE